MADMEDRDEVPQRLKRSEDEGGTTWYFAYGSNMRNSVIQKRGLTAIAKINVLIPSYRLSFDVFGVPYSEPAMASITASRVPDHVCDAHPVHGVAILLSKADYVQMLVSEGAGTAYDEIVLEAIPVQGRDGIMVRTLVARYPFRPNFSPRPSRRYMDLLIDGAAEHQLPATYQAYLRSLPTFTQSTAPNATKAATIFHFLWLPTIQCIMRWIKGASMTKAGKSPRWTGTVVWALFNAMWLHHDWIHARLWVRGDGRLESEA